MKTILKDGIYERVGNEVAEIRVKNQGWTYTSKANWKVNVRDKVSKAVVEQEEKKEKTVEKKLEKRMNLKKKQRASEPLDNLLK